ncbi:Antifungal protein ginkbilobin-like protein 1 [Linum perenne]
MVRDRDYRSQYPDHGSPPVVYGHGFCKRTFGIQSTCRTCLRHAKRLLLHRCPHRIGGEIVLDMCSLRYAKYPV